MDLIVELHAARRGHGSELEKKLEHAAAEAAQLVNSAPDEDERAQVVELIRAETTGVPPDDMIPFPARPREPRLTLFGLTLLLLLCGTVMSFLVLPIGILALSFALMTGALAALRLILPGRSAER